MNFEKAEELVEKNFSYIKKLNKDFEILTDKMIVDFEESISGDTSLQNSQMNIGIEYKQLSKTSGISEEALFSYVFYHEMGHQILPWTFIENKDRANLMNEFFDDYNKYQEEVPHEFLFNKNLSYFNDSKLFDLHIKLVYDHQGEFDNLSSETRTILQNIGMKIDAVYNEQFAECFSLFMLKKQFPNQFDKLASHILENRQLDEKMYKKSAEDKIYDEYLKPGFVHSVNNVSEEFINILKNKKINSFEEFKDVAAPLIDKHTTLEIQEAMKNHKVISFFPKELLSTESSVKDKIKAIRKINEQEVQTSLKKNI